MKLLLVLSLLLSGLLAQDIAIVRDVDGIVNVNNSGKINKIKKGDALQSGDIIMTSDNSSVTVIFDDNSNLVIGSNSLLNIDTYIFRPKERKYSFKMSIQKGSLSFESGKIGELAPESFTLTTPEGVVAIRGTKFFVKVN